MKGSRPLSDQEVQQVVHQFSGPYALRDRALFILGIKTGLRISELLSLRMGDVVQHGRVVDRVSVQRRHMKKKVEGRTVLLHPEAKEALAVWFAQMSEIEDVTRETALFRSRKGRGAAIGRKQAWRILTKCYAEAGLQGTLGTHAMRKTFAQKVHVLLGRDLVKTQRALGHRKSTARFHT